MELMIIFIAKLADTLLNTLKSIFTFQNRRALATISLVLSNLIYLLIMVKIMNEPTVANMIVTLAAMALGNQWGMVLGEKYEKEKVWRITIKMEREQGKAFADMLRLENFAVQTYSARGKELDERLVIEVYSPNKETSASLKQLLPDGVLTDVVEIKNKF